MKDGKLLDEDRSLLWRNLMEERRMMRLMFRPCFFWLFLCCFCGCVGLVILTMFSFNAFLFSFLGEHVVSLICLAYAYRQFGLIPNLGLAPLWNDECDPLCFD